MSRRRMVTESVISEGVAYERILFERVAGIDISKSDAKVCVQVVVGDGRVWTETRRFGATMAQIRLLRDWLVASGVQRVLMESTSAYWKPFWDGLVDAGFEVVLANANEVKQVRGRKTDVSDAAWLALLARVGAVRSSFVPARDIRDLRLATRARSKLVGRATSVAASLEKLLEDTGMKLSSASSKLLTVSGRSILDAVCDGLTDPAQLAELSRLRKTTGQALVDALESRVRPVHQVLIRSYLDQLDFLAAQIQVVQTEIDRLAAPFEAEIAVLCTAPGIERVLACAIIAEIGVDMTQFEDPDHLTSWAGLAPGSNKTADRARPTGVKKGNKHLKAALSQAARSAVMKNDTFLQARFRKVRARRGDSKAYTAVARSLLVSLWAMLSRHEPYSELGGDYYTRTATTTQRNRLQANAEATLTRLGINYTINTTPH